MTLKTRLTIAVATIIVVAAGLIGLFTVQVVRSSLLDQVDRRLLDVAFQPRPQPPPVGEETGSAADGQPGPPGRRGADGADIAEVDESLQYRTFTDLIYEADGTPVVLRPSGFTEDPDPLPAIDQTALADLLGNPTTVAAVDGTVEFRAIAVELNSGRIQVIAESMEDEQELATRVRNLAVAGGLIVTLTAAGLAWFVVRRELQPVDRMIDAAGDIARGDLSRRIDHHRAGTELGDLSGALDEMISELESAFADRQDGEERLRRFAADASHELRTPLTAISGYAELYRQGGIPAGESLDTAFMRIESESARMTSLVEDLLLLARLDQQLPLDRSPVDLEALVTEAARDLRAIDPSRPVTVSTSGPAPVIGDEHRLRQVIGNLVSNSVHHTPAGTAIHLSSSVSGDEARIEVADDGPGIPPEHQDRVFERFYRGDKSRPADRNGTGSGLGLSIVTRIVEAHGGRISVVSPAEHVGTGAGFEVSLPTLLASEPQP